MGEAGRLTTNSASQATILGGLAGTYLILRYIEIFA